MSEERKWKDSLRALLFWLLSIHLRTSFFDHIVIVGRKETKSPSRGVLINFDDGDDHVLTYLESEIKNMNAYLGSEILRWQSNWGV